MAAAVARGLWALRGVSGMGGGAGGARLGLLLPAPASKGRCQGRSFSGGCSKVFHHRHTRAANSNVSLVPVTLGLWLRQWLLTRGVRCVLLCMPAKAPHSSTREDCVCIPYHLVNMCVHGSLMLNLRPACLPCKGAGCLLRLILAALNGFGGRRHVMAFGLPRLLTLAVARHSCICLAPMLFRSGLQWSTGCSCAAGQRLAAHGGPMGMRQTCCITSSCCSQGA